MANGTAVDFESLTEDQLQRVGSPQANAELLRRRYTQTQLGGIAQEGLRSIPAGYRRESPELFAADTPPEAPYGGRDVPGVAPVPLLEPQGVGQPDLTYAPPADQYATMRDLGTAVTRRLPGPGGAPLYTNRTDAELAAPGQEQFAEGAGGRTYVGAPGALRGGFEYGGRRYGGTLNPEDLAAAEARGTAAAATTGRQQDAETRLRDLLAQKRRYLNAPEIQANLDREIAITQQELGLAGAEGMPAAERARKLAETGRATQEAVTAPGAREKAAMEIGIEREKIAGRTAAASVQGLEAHEVARQLGIEQAQITVMGALELQQLKNGATRAEKELDRDIQRGNISRELVKNLGTAFSQILAEKDPAKKAEMQGYLLHMVRQVSELVGAETGKQGTPAAGATAGTKAPPDIRKQAEATAKRQGKVLKPGQQFDIGGKVYVY